MSYPSVVAAALSGASLRQLSYWRSSRSTEEPLLSPTLNGSRVGYSFQDVVALRTVVYLRAKNVPLQRVREAVQHLRRQLDETEYQSSYKLLAVGKGVVWRISDDTALDLTTQRGNYVIAEMVDILAAFRNANDRVVVPLHKPMRGLAVDPGIRGGFPVIEGTRVPYDMVSALVRDGVPPEDVADYYPSVRPETALGARDFAAYLDQYLDKAAA